MKIYDYKTVRGSNQYATRFVRYGRYYRQPQRRIGLGIGLAILVTGYGLVLSMLFFGRITFQYLKTHPLFEQVNAQVAIISPIPDEAQSILKPLYKPIPTPEEKHTGEYEKIDAEIRNVFGKYYPTAMLLLKGNGGNGCRENSTLDPNQTNTFGNYPAGSKDVGVFMINNHWQGVTNEEFLKDYTINIRMAYNIFVRSGYSFKMWTCGVYYHI